MKKTVKPLTRNAKAIYELAKTFDGDFTFNEFKAKLIKLDDKIAATLPNQIIVNYFAMLERRKLMYIKKMLNSVANLYRVIKRD